MTSVLRRGGGDAGRRRPSTSQGEWRRRGQPCPHLELGLRASRSVRQWMAVVSSPAPPRTHACTHAHTCTRARTHTCTVVPSHSPGRDSLCRCQKNEMVIGPSCLPESTLPGSSGDPGAPVPGEEAEPPSHPDASPSRQPELPRKSPHPEDPQSFPQRKRCSPLTPGPDGGRASRSPQAPVLPLRNLWAQRRLLWVYWGCK